MSAQAVLFALLPLLTLSTPQAASHVRATSLVATTISAYETCPDDSRQLRVERENGLEVWCERLDARGFAELHGPWTKRHPNGNMAVYVLYRAGKQDGPYMIWHPSGRIAEYGTYRAGKRHGRVRSWYDNGTKAWQQMFRRGRRHGRFKVWNVDGALTDRGTYLRDKLQ